MRESIKMRAPHGEKRLALRRWLPEPIKKWMRLVRLATAAIPPWAPDVPQRQLDGCVLLQSRLTMLDRLDPGLIICEVGCETGGFALEILSRCRPEMLHSIDIDLTKLSDKLNGASNFTIHQGLSHAVLDSFPDETFDVIYIDADHAYSAVCNDISHSIAKLKPGGLLAFNDFARIGRVGFGVFGVHQAVCEFAVQSGWPFVYFCLNAQALYDVVLRKPS
jgi:SAM-dependent methyltransferase